MKKQLSLNPWINIWVKPRKTIQELVQYNVNYRLITICGLYGFLHILYFLLKSPYLEKAIELKNYNSLASLIIGSLIFAIPAGYILVNLTSLFLFLAGKLIKAKGSFKEVRAAFYWSTIPIIPSLFILNILMIVFAKQFEMFEKTTVTPQSSSLFVFFGFTQLFLGFWGFIVTLKSLAQVQGFSAWMGLLNYFFGFIIAAIFSLVVFGAVSSFR